MIYNGIKIKEENGMIYALIIIAVIILGCKALDIWGKK
jgi:hypothetical protein